MNLTRVIGVIIGIFSMLIIIRFGVFVLQNSIRYWYLILFAFLIVYATTSVRSRRKKKRNKARVLIARAEAGHRNYLEGGTGLFETHERLFQPHDKIL